MNHSRRIALGLVGVGVIAGAIALNPFSAPVTAVAAPERLEAGPMSYQLDPVHSSVIFRVTHMGASHFYGRFHTGPDEGGEAGISGSFSLGDTASIDVTLKADHVDTGNPKRDAHVKSPDFFSAKEFPEIKAVGSDLKKAGDGSWKGTVDLTFRGVTKKVDITLNQTGSGKGMDGKTQLAGVETTFTIKRSEYGSKGLIPAVSDDVMLIVALEGGAK